MTTKQVQAIERLNRQGLTDREIGEKLRMRRSAVNYWRDVKLNLPANGEKGARYAGEIERLNRQGLTDWEIAEKLGMCRGTVYKWRHQKLGLPAVGRRGNWRRKRKRYIVRRKEDDSFVAMGSAEECARIMGIKTDSFHAAKSRQDRQGKWEIVEAPEEDI